MILGQLSPGGSLSRALLEYEDRPGQRKMAEAVAATIENGGISLIEAGTGTGKTLAYLLPAALSGARILISTGTKALQDQIAQRDLPLVSELVDRELRFAVVKGSANYLCRRRFYSSQTPAKLGRAHGRILEWLEETETGDRAESSDAGIEDHQWQEISTHADGRLRSRCPQFDRCFVARARRLAEDADIVIVNHHLLCADLALRRSGGESSILPDADVYILDEAHLLEGALTEHFSVSVSSASVRRLTTDLRQWYQERSDEDTSAWERDLAGLGDSWQSLMAALRSRVATGRRRSALEGGIFSDPRIETGWFAVDDRLANISGDLLRRAYEGHGATSECARILAAQVSKTRESLASIADEHNENVVRFVQDQGPGLSLSAAPIDIAPVLDSALLAAEKPTVLTSATLSCAGSFRFVRQRLGLDERADELRIASPFAYEQNTLLYIGADLPDPRDEDFAAAAV